MSHNIVNNNVVMATAAMVSGDSAVTADDSVDNTNETIPNWVAKYCHNRDQRLPQTAIYNIDRCDQKIVKSLCNFFKCTHSWSPSATPDQHSNESNDESDGRDKCFATRNTAIQFNIHLDKCHPNDQLYCSYCLQLVSNQELLKRYTHRYLIKHMLKRHLFRRFQCNQCLYRAITIDHLYVHQETQHPKSYENAIKGIKEGVVSKIYRCQLIDAMPTIDNMSRRLYDYYRKYRSNRLNSEGKNETLYQCMYCQFMDEVLKQVVNHCVHKHPDYPILYYIPEPQVTSSSAATPLVNDVITFDVMIVRPKLEPQDNSVSSTQRTPEISDKIAEREKRPQVNETGGQSNTPSILTQTVSSILSEDSHSKKICLFCYQLLTESQFAAHIWQHFPVTDAGDETTCQAINNWIKQLLLKQMLLCSYDDNSDTNSIGVYLCCPLCVQLSKLNDRIAKRYRNYGEFRNHLWQHCCWLSVKCKLCKQYQPNCDPIIAKHFKDNHFSHLAIDSSKYPFLTSNELDITFTLKEYSYLEKSFIEVKPNKVIESRIRQMAKELRQEFETKLTAKCLQDLNRVNVVVKRMPKSVANHHIKEYQDYENRKNGKQVVTSVKIPESHLVSEMIPKIIDKITEDDRPLAQIFNDHKKKKKGRPKKDGHEKGRKKTSQSDSRDSGDKTGDNSSDKFTPLLTEINVALDSCRTSSSSAAEPEPTPSTSGQHEQTEDNDDMECDEEESKFIKCRHCNDRFRNKKEFNQHSRDRHRGMPIMAYARQRPK